MARSSNRFSILLGALLGLLSLLAIEPTAFPRDVRVSAGLRKGQSYELARKRLIHLGFRAAPTHLVLTDFEADRSHPEITCGYLKDEPSLKSLCAVSFENRRGDYISLELRKTRLGFVIANL